MHLVACIPNFSEGRDSVVIDAIKEAIVGKPAVSVIDTHSDPDHHRSVITFIGQPQHVMEAALAGSRVAIERIDLKRHRGGHPRIGAVDVIAYVPLAGVTMAECIDLAGRTARHLAEKYGVPAYLYGEAAVDAGRRDLSFIRRGGFEGLSREIATDPLRKPDFGPSLCHPTAGAVAVGARDHIVNLNVDLDSRDMQMAHSIARAVRGSSGGMPGVRAIAVDLESRSLVQVSTVIDITRHHDVQSVFNVIASEAVGRGCQVKRGEIVGLFPARALGALLDTTLKTYGFDPLKKVFEVKIFEHFLKGDAGVVIQPWAQTIEGYCKAVASPVAVPSGGTAATSMA
ncbi:MAG: glutamate formimidoyltransferase, partial [Elusimicrobiota bacterium]